MCTEDEFTFKRSGHKPGSNTYQTKTSQIGNQTAQKKSLMLSIQVATKNHYPNMNAVI